MTIRRALVLASVALATALPISAAQATSCPGLEQAYDAARSSAVTFLGTSGPELASQPGWRTWPFAVHASTAGDVASSTTVRLPSGICGYELHTGCLYAIAADPAEGGGYEIRPGHSGGATLIVC